MNIMPYKKPPGGLSLIIVSFLSWIAMIFILLFAKSISKGYR